VSLLQAEIQQIAGRRLTIRHLKTFEIQKALPIVRPDTTQAQEKNGIFHWGDHTLSPSIDGALKSGRILAESLMARV
jgi:hypothetical protein